MLSLVKESFQVKYNLMRAAFNHKNEVNDKVSCHQEAGNITHVELHHLVRQKVCKAHHCIKSKHYNDLIKKVL